MIRNNRRGMVLYLVSIVVVMVGLFISILHYSQSQNRRIFFSKKEKAQAQFLARGAQQHFLLKIKFLAAQMYEAAGFSVGRNPYYDFGAYMTGANTEQVFPVDDPAVGPLFFTGGNNVTVIQLVNPSSDDKLAPAGSKVMFVDRSKEDTSHSGGAATLYAGPAYGPSSYSSARGSPKGNWDVMTFPLEHFLVDVCGDFPPVSSGRQPIIQFNSTVGRSDWAQMGKGNSETVGGAVKWFDPFVGNYYVQDFRILGQGGAGSRAGKKYEADSVLVYTEAQVRVQGQVSPVSQISGTPKKLDTVAGELQARFSGKEGSGWTELELVQESAEDVKKRLFEQYNKDTKQWEAAHRTEIVTATYFIRRPL